MGTFLPIDQVPRTLSPMLYLDTLKVKSERQNPTPFSAQEFLFTPWKTVKSPLGTGATPSRCPDSKLDVPANVRSQVIQWDHSSGHPGANRTTSFIQRKFWWPEMREDICLLGLRPSQGNAPTTTRLTSTTSYPAQTLVSHSTRFHHRLTTI